MRGESSETLHNHVEHLYVCGFYNTGVRLQRLTSWYSAKWTLRSPCRIAVKMYAINARHVQRCALTTIAFSTVQVSEQRFAFEHYRLSQATTPHETPTQVSGTAIQYICVVAMRKECTRQHCRNTKVLVKRLSATAIRLEPHTGNVHWTRLWEYLSTNPVPFDSHPAQHWTKVPMFNEPT